MLRFSVACSLLILVYGASIKDDSQLDGRIVGGHAININQAPHQAAYQVNNNQVCGASIISNYFVLCAAHCSYRDNAREVTIRVGSSYRNSGGTVHQASQLINHAQYASTSVPDHDISLIKVTTPFTYSGSVRPISLATALPADGSSVVASGWGVTYEGGSVSSQLLQVQISIISHAQCNRAYGGLITSDMVCAGEMSGGKDTCQKDSGGPLVYGTQLVGIVSWGGGCGRAGSPGVYASVPTFRAWIKQHAGV